MERYPPGVDSHTVIYDAHGLDPLKNLDFDFMKALMPPLCRHFPGRLHSVVVINGHWTMTGFWAAVSLLLDSITKAKISLHGQEFDKPDKSLLAKFGPDHPYLQYALRVRSLIAKEAALEPLPKSTPYTPRWRESLELGGGGSTPSTSEKLLYGTPSYPGAGSRGLLTMIKTSSWPFDKEPAPAPTEEEDSFARRRQVSDGAPHRRQITPL